jgi:hypothetical protein
VREDCNRNRLIFGIVGCDRRLVGPDAPPFVPARGLSRPSAMNYWAGNPDRGLIPKCFSFDCSVVCFNPNRAAAPFSPPICPWLSRKARRMCSRSVAFVSLVGGSRLLFLVTQHREGFTL